MKNGMLTWKPRLHIRTEQNPLSDHIAGCRGNWCGHGGWRSYSEDRVRGAGSDGSCWRVTHSYRNWSADHRSGMGNWVGHH